MKAIKLILLGTVLFLTSIVQAQVSVNVNIGSPPSWGPVGYTEVRYYYLPDVEAYYDVQTSMFIYFGEGVWVHRAYLPARYRDYDLYYGYKVVMPNYHGNSPYVHFKEYRMKYAKGYHGKEQKTIGQKPGKGNSKANTFSNGNSNQKGNQGNNNNMKANYGKGGGNNNSKNNHSNGGGNGKKR
ncbi:MAG: hypothetical protein A2X08_10245 [Bacteroidetes bacterium GWA2_32_17]|nr:MAG: hypothetical protein A2X08_10245 [Bacteroidetes bacterium GWA2_32_17]